VIRRSSRESTGDKVLLTLSGQQTVVLPVVGFGKPAVGLTVPASWTSLTPCGYGVEAVRPPAGTGRDHSRKAMPRGSSRARIGR